MRKALTVTLILLCAVFIPGTAWAAGRTNAGISVSPAITQINLTSGQDTASFNTQVTNNTTSSAVIYLSTQDFTTLGENGSLSFVQSNVLNDGPHGLANWIRLGFTQVALAPGQSQTVPASIPNANELSPGGHYAAINYQINSTANPSKNHINSNEAVSSLVFLTTAGQSTQAVALDRVPWSTLNITIPSSINLVFTNTGNTQTAPRGVVTITNSSNKEVARGIVNVDSGLVLPATSRLYNIALRSEVKVYAPGVYHLKIEYQAANATKFMVYTRSFGVTTEPLAVALVIIVLLSAVLLIRKYNPANSYTLKP